MTFSFSRAAIPVAVNPPSPASLQGADGVTQAFRPETAEHRSTKADSSASIVDPATSLESADVQPNLLRRLKTSFAAFHMNALAIDSKYWRMPWLWVRDDGRLSVICSRTERHLPTFNTVFTRIDTIDYGATCEQEIVYTNLPTGYTMYADSGGVMPDGALGIVSVRQKDGGVGRIAYDPPIFIRFDPVTSAPTFSYFTYAAGVDPDAAIFHYGYIRPLKKLGPNYRQVWFYGNGIYRSIYDGTSWGPITRMFTNPAGATLGEPCGGELPDGRSYVLMGNPTPPYTAYGAFSSDGVTYDTPRPMPYPFGRSPAFISEERDDLHILFARSNSSGSVLAPVLDHAILPTIRSGLASLYFNPETFWTTKGASGYDDGGWQPEATGAAWFHGQGNLTKDWFGNPVGVITMGERPGHKGLAANATQGSSNAIAIISTLPQPRPSMQQVIAQIGHKPGVPFTYNPTFQTWQQGVGPINSSATAWVMGPDGHGLRRSSGAIGAYAAQVVEAGEDQAWAYEFGRVAGNASTDRINTILAVPFAEVKKHRGSWVHAKVRAKLGPNFSGGVLQFNALSSSLDMIVSSTDGSIGTILIPQEPLSATAIVTASSDQYQEWGLAFRIPVNCRTLVLRLAYVPTGTAGAGDYVRLTQWGGYTGHYMVPYVQEDFELSLRRCQRIVQKSYAFNAFAGTVTPNGQIADAARTAAIRSTILQTRFSGGEMQRDPEVLIYGSGNGTLGQLYDVTTPATTGIDAELTSKNTKGFSVTNIGAAPAAGDVLALQYVALAPGFTVV